MSECWNILGILPTPLIAEIKRAYVRLLKIHKPDEDPQGFMRLRKAYEEALYAAKYLSTDLIAVTNEAQGDIKTTNPVEVSLLQSSGVDSVEALYQAWVTLYQDQKESWNLNAWLGLLQSPVFENVEMSRQAYAQFICLFTQNPFAPSTVFTKIADMSDFHHSYTFWEKYLPEGIANGFYEILRFVNLRLANENLQYFTGNEDQLRDLVGVRRELENAYVNRIIFDNEEQGSLNAIFELAEKALSIWPADSEVRCFYGRLLWADRKGELALSQFASIDLLAIKSQSIMQETLLHLFEISYRLNKPDAGNWAAKLLQHDANNIHALKYFARQHYVSGRYEEALSLLADLLKIHPEDFELRTLSTQIHLQYLDQLIQPEHGLRRLEILYELKRYDECIQFYDLYSPYFLHAGSLSRALCYLEKNDNDLAFQDFETVCQYLVADQQNIGELVKEIAFHGSETLTEEWLNNYGLPNIDFLIKSTQNDYSYFVAAAMLVYRYAEFQEDDEQAMWYQRASDYIEIALSLNAKDAYVNFKAGHIFTKNNEHRKALRVYQYCRATYDNWFLLHDNMAICFKNIEMYEEAIEAHRRCFNMSVYKPYQVWQLSRIIELYEELDDEESAESCRQELSELEVEA